jgi:hypothetical protein
MWGKPYEVNPDPPQFNLIEKITMNDKVLTIEGLTNVNIRSSPTKRVIVKLKLNNNKNGFDVME